MLKPSLEKRVLRLQRLIEKATIKCRLNLTIYDGGIGFVDQEARKIVAVWRPQYKMPPEQIEKEEN